MLETKQFQPAKLQKKNEIAKFQKKFVSLQNIFGPVVQRIEFQIPVLTMAVRIRPGLQKTKSLKTAVLLDFSEPNRKRLGFFNLQNMQKNCIFADRTSVIIL